mgnify:CR=1 FL=1
MSNSAHNFCHVVTPSTALAISVRSALLRCGRLSSSTGADRLSLTHFSHFSGTSTASGPPSPSTMSRPNTDSVSESSHAQSMCRSNWSRVDIHLVDRVGFGSVRFPSTTTIDVGVRINASGYEKPSRIYQADSGKGSCSIFRTASAIVSGSFLINWHRLATAFSLLSRAQPD